MGVKRKGKLKKNINRLENGIIRGLVLSGVLVAQRAQMKAPRATGRLKRSLSRGDPFKTGSNHYAIEVGTNIEYARAHEFGSGIHAEDPAYRELILIEPGAGKMALAFKWANAPADMPAGTGGLHYFRRVFHPGVPAQPYLRPALRESREDIRMILLKSVVGSLTGGE